MQTATEVERLVAVETKLDIAIGQIGDLGKKMDDLLGNYVPRTEYDKDLEALELKAESNKKELESKIKDAKRRTTLQTWLTGTLGTIFGVIMTILIQGYFSK